MHLVLLQHNTHDYNTHNRPLSPPRRDVAYAPLSTNSTHKSVRVLSRKTAKPSNLKRLFSLSLFFLSSSSEVGRKTEQNSPPPALRGSGENRVINSFPPRKNTHTIVAAFPSKTETKKQKKELNRASLYILAGSNVVKMLE